MRVSLEEAAQSIHLPTLILLFSFMVVSAQMRLGGFYDGVTRWLVRLPLAPPLLIGALILVVAALSAVFSNDIVCLAMAPVLIDACRAPAPRTRALPAGARLRRQHRLGGDPDRQPAEHADRRDAAPVVRRLPAARRRCRSALGLVATWALMLALTRGRLWTRRRLAPKAIASTRCAEEGDPARRLADDQGPGRGVDASSPASCSRPGRARWSR